MCNSKSNKIIHVAVGVVRNSKGQILIAKRPEHVHQGGLWEFPGGKVDAGESVESALARELHEELNIAVICSSPLITIPHDYQDKRVLLDVHLVPDYSGEPHGNEGQLVQWLDPVELMNFQFPEANRPIIMTLSLPDKYLITGKFSDFMDCEQKVRGAIKRGIRLIQLREKEMEAAAFVELANRLYEITSQADAKLVLNTSLELFQKTPADGIHFTGTRLAECEHRPVGKHKLFSASTHTLEELQHAASIGADFAMLSPVLPTNSHPGEPALGWEAFREIVEQVNIPVYALGGMTEEHIAQAQRQGAQGIAAITALWEQN